MIFILFVIFEDILRKLLQIWELERIWKKNPFIDHIPTCQQ